MRRIRSRVLRWFGVRRTLGLSMLAAFVALRIWDPAPLENLRLRSFDFYQSLKPRDAQARPVVIVDIDEDSMRSVGQWPWPRTVVADLVAKLRALGSAAIGFDVIFAEADRLSPQSAVSTFRGVDEETKAKLRDLPSNDQVMANAIRGGRVVLGQSGIAGTSAAAATPNMPQTGFATMGPDPSDYLVTFPSLLRNVPELEQAAQGRGLLTIRNERDGIVRRVPLVAKAGGIVAPALTLDMLRVVTNSGAILMRTDAAGIRSVGFPGVELPTDRNGQIWVYFAPHDITRFVSAKDVLEGRVPPDRLAGKLVLIGTSAVGLLDTKTTPLDAVMPGVEVHAQVLEAALTGETLSYPNFAIVAELVVAVAVGAAIAIMAPVMGAVPLFVMGAAAVLTLIGLSWYFFSAQNVLLDVTFALMSSFTIYVVLVFIGYFREQADRRRIRSAFSQYLSPALVEQLAASPDKLKLGGEEKPMTIMFSDVRGFTSISESFKSDPQGLTQLMNRFLTPLTNAIIDRRGTIDKYMGDAIMAFWNAPIDDPDHEIHACQAALDMLARIDALNEERMRESEETGQAFIPFKMGIGLNTGPCVVGNMGSDLRFDYSVLGDPVNLASRLEGRSKSYGLPIIIGAATAEKAKPRFAALEIDLITVKGKTQPETIYTILGGEDVRDGEDFRKLHELHEKMLRLYRGRDWTGAWDALQFCKLEKNGFGLDEVYTLYASRIRLFQEQPPADDWDGVHAFDTK
jgi:adenylate cyclase